MNRSISLLFAFLLFYGSVNAQSRPVTGKVTISEDGSALPGVSVLVKGTNRGTQTNSSGNYEITAAPGETLVFSFIGLISKQENVANRTVINVNLESDENLLNETIVVGYSSLTKPAITGSISLVKPESIENRPFTSVDKALQGNVAGLQSVAANGTPGGAQNIRIRGTSSINASNEPLWIIDGVPVNSGDASRLTTTANLLSTLNPNDIESISVLKDAASQSIYGSRAANGVIVVTTKSGKAGKTRFRFDTEIGSSDIAWQNPSSRPLNASEYLEITREGLLNGGYTEANTNSILTGLGQGNEVDFNWLDAVTKTGTQQQYNLSAEGGNEKTTFFVSAGNFRQEGIIINTDYKRSTGNVRITHKANNKLRFNVNLNGGHVNQRTPLGGGAFGNPVGSAYFLLPTRSPYNEDGTFTTTNLGTHNTLALTEWDKRRLKETSLRGNTYVEYDILPNLSFKTSLGADFNILEEDQYNNPTHGDGQASNGRAFAYYTRYFNWTWTNTLNYIQKLNQAGDVNLNLQAGYESQASRGYFSNVQSQGFLPFYSLEWPASGSTPITSSAYISDYTFVSQFLAGNLNYKNRYVLSGSFRRDGSSRFSPDNKYGNFWSVGATYNIDQEEFFSDVDYISQLKIRTSYGVNGNAGLNNNYPWQTVYATGYNYNQLTGIAPSGVGNPDLTWELNKPFNIAVDLGFLKNRITLTAEWYTRSSENLLLSVPLSRTTGFATATRNVGSLKNTGVEITIGATPVKTGDFTWDLDFNFANNHNEITKLPENNKDIISGTQIYRVGESFQTVYTREYAGVDPANGDPLWYIVNDNGEKTTTNVYGSATVQVLSGKSPLPKIFGGFNNKFTYKGISLEAQLYYNFGNYVRDSFSSYYVGAGYSPSDNKIARVLDRWQQPGDITDIPKIVYNGNKSFHSFSSFYLNEGDYVRLRNIQLGYTIPAKVLQNIGINSLFVYGRGTNLFTWVKSKNLAFDPESGASSTSSLGIFIPKTFTVGINAGF